MPDGLGLQLHFGDLPVVLRGRLAESSFEFLRDHLDGRRSLDELAAAVPEDLPLPTVLRTLRLLHTKGLIVDGGAPFEASLTWRAEPDPVIGRQLLFWGRHVGGTRAASSGAQVQSRLGHATVALVGAGLFGAATADLLSRSGCGEVRLLAWDDGPAESIGGVRMLDAMTTSVIKPATTASAGPDTLAVVTETLRSWVPDLDLVVTATRNAPDQLMELINRLCQQTATPWLRGNLEGSAIELGPYVQPHGSACFSCLRLRSRSADPMAIEHELDHAERMKETNAQGLPPLGESLFGATLGASHLTGEVIRIITGIAIPALLNRVRTISPATGDERVNTVARVPRCPECSYGTVHLIERRA